MSNIFEGTLLSIRDFFPFYYVEIVTNSYEYLTKSLKNHLFEIIYFNSFHLFHSTFDPISNQNQFQVILFVFEETFSMQFILFLLHWSYEFLRIIEIS